MGVVSQGTARFENRLRSDCALIPRLSCCRNLGADEFSKITDDDDPRLLPAQVTLWAGGEMTRRIRKTIPGIVLIPDLASIINALRSWRAHYVPQPQ